MPMRSEQEIAAAAEQIAPLHDWHELSEYDRQCVRNVYIALAWALGTDSTLIETMLRDRERMLENVGRQVEGN